MKFTRQPESESESEPEPESESEPEPESESESEPASESEFARAWLAPGSTSQAAKVFAWLVGHKPSGAAPLVLYAF